MRTLAGSLGVEVDLAVATDRINRRQASRLVKRIVEECWGATRVAVLGLTYKPFTPVAEEAFGVHLARELLAAGLSVSAYDPSCDNELPGIDRADPRRPPWRRRMSSWWQRPGPNSHSSRSSAHRSSSTTGGIVPTGALSPSARIFYQVSGPRLARGSCCEHGRNT